MEMRVEHAEITASSAFSGRQAVLNVGCSALSNRTARISASSSTRRGRIDTVRLRKSRCAYSRFSSSMPSRVRLYVSSNVFGKSFKTPRILAGKQRRSLSTWQMTHRNLQGHVSAYYEASRRKMNYETTYMPSTLSDRVSMTKFLSSSFHLCMLRSERTTDLMYAIMSSFCPISS